MRKKKLLQIDVDKCLSNNLDFNEYGVLFHLCYNNEILNLENIESILKSLEEKCFITKQNESYILRVRGNKLLNIVNQEDLKVENWVDEYRNLFPTGVKSGGYPVRGSKKTCIDNLKKFIIEFGKDKKTILEATKIYIENKSKENFNYIMLSHYFIYKNGSSMLESYIEDLESRETDYFEQFHKEV